MAFVPNTRSPYATIVTKKGDFAYRLTSEDVLWAARSAFFEGGNPGDVLWTETQRFVLYRRDYPNFTLFVRAFSQPINPDWQRTGMFCRPGGKYENGAYCSAQQLDLRDRASHISWREMYEQKPKVVEDTLLWANGQLPNPVPRATNFADPAVSASWLEKNPTGTVLKTAGNVYIVQEQSANWAHDHVQLKRPGGGLMRVVARSMVKPWSNKV